MNPSNEALLAATQQAYSDGVGRDAIVRHLCKQPGLVSGGFHLQQAIKAIYGPAWTARYMTANAYANVKPPEFLVDGFLVKDSIAMLGGPVAQRKSIIALNIAHALCTGEPLFGYFNVAEKPTRAVYLCPEMGAASFVKRIKQIGLGGYVGKTLFIQTMSEQPTALDELDGELPGAVVIVDTITRFIEGDENKSEDMRRFAQKVFRLVKVVQPWCCYITARKAQPGSWMTACAVALSWPRSSIPVGSQNWMTQRSPMNRCQRCGTSSSATSNQIHSG